MDDISTCFRRDVAEENDAGRIEAFQLFDLLVSSLCSIGQSSTIAPAFPANALISSQTLVHDLLLAFFLLYIFPSNVNSSAPLLNAFTVA